MATRRPTAPKPNPDEYTGSARQLRALLYLEGRSERRAHIRAEWPELWQVVERLVYLVDRDFPSVMRSHPTLF